MKTRPNANDVDRDRLGEHGGVGQVLRVMGGFLREYVQA
jgi:hypothetical protein